MDCVKMFATPHAVEKEMLRCAHADGPQTIIGYMPGVTTPPQPMSWRANVLPGAARSDCFLTTIKHFAANQQTRINKDAGQLVETVGC